MQFDLPEMTGMFFCRVLSPHCDGGFPSQRTSKNTSCPLCINLRPGKEKVKLLWWVWMAIGCVSNVKMPGALEELLEAGGELQVLDGVWDVFATVCFFNSRLKIFYFCSHSLMLSYFHFLICVCFMVRWYLPGSMWSCMGRAYEFRKPCKNVGFEVSPFKLREQTGLLLKTPWAKMPHRDLLRLLVTWLNQENGTTMFAVIYTKRWLSSKGPS